VVERRVIRQKFGEVLCKLGKEHLPKFHTFSRQNSETFDSPFIWPTLCLCACVRVWFRPYIFNLLPCLLRVCQRPEEMVHETLAASMAKISPVLIGFMTDMETKVIIVSH